MTTQTRTSKSRFHFQPGRVLVYGILILFSVFYILPVYLIL